MEMVVVMAILIAMASIIVPLIRNQLSSAQTQASTASVIAVRAAALQYYQDLGQWPQTVADLFRASTALPSTLQSYDPVVKRGWNGPYLQGAGSVYPKSTDLDSNGNAYSSLGFFPANAVYGIAGDPAVLDSWGHPIVIQYYVGAVTTGSPADYLRIVAAGSNGMIETSNSVIYPTRASCGDDEVLYLKVPDLRPSP
jgi:type II secretory pathway pseudopilin PulG